MSRKGWKSGWSNPQMVPTEHLLALADHEVSTAYYAWDFGLDHKDRQEALLRALELIREFRARGQQLQF